MNPEKTSHPQKSPIQWIEITQNQAGRRIDHFLQALLKNVPISRIYRMLRKGEVRINHKRTKPSDRLVIGDHIRLPPFFLEPLTPQPQISPSLRSLLKNRILFEDENLMILNKPEGLAVQGGSGIKTSIIQALKTMYPNIPELELVHRLDKDTSGCLILAKKNHILRELHALLRQGAVTKIYWAFTEGRWPSEKTEVSLPLKKAGLDSRNSRNDSVQTPYRASLRSDSRDPEDENIKKRTDAQIGRLYRENNHREEKYLMEVHEDGKAALTEFHVLKSFPEGDLVEVLLKTGRTHQIRVHASVSGHPVAGDEKYGDREFNQTMKAQGLHRLFLHAHRVQFYLASCNQTIDVSAPLDPDLQKVLDGAGDGNRTHAISLGS